MLHRFRDITTFTVYVIHVSACDREKSFRFSNKVETTDHMCSLIHNIDNTC